jgi:hypothetical protein
MGLSTLLGRRLLMWMFTQSGFFSIVAHRDDPDILIVKARVKGDIEAYWPQAKVFETPEADYLYRAYMSKDVVAERVGKIVANVDYDSYKGHITDKRRGSWYLAVWNAMAHMQCSLRHAN